MLKQDKERVVAEIVERLRTSETLLVADYRGLTHAELDNVRTELLKLGARFAVVKNTLTRRAAEAAGVETLEDFLSGPTAIAFVTEGDAAGVAKVLSDTARETRRLTLKGGVVQGRVVDGDAIRELATLPPLDVLRGQLLGAIVGPASSIVGIFAAPLRDLVGVLDARIRQIDEPGADADAPAAAEGIRPSAGEASLAPTAPPEEPTAEEPAADVEAGPAPPEEPIAEEPAADEGTGPAPPEQPSAEDQPSTEEAPAEDQPAAEEPPAEEASPAEEIAEAEEAAVAEEAQAEQAESETQDEPETQEEET